MTKPDMCGFVEPPSLINEGSMKLVKILNWFQVSDVSVPSAIKELRKVFDPIKDNVPERRKFFQNLVFTLQVPLTNGSCKERPNVFDEKMFEVICRFVASYIEDQKKEENQTQDMPWIIVKLFVWLLDHHGASSSCARLRICLLINWLLKNFGDFELDDGLYDKIFNSMLERLTDKVAEIRAQAVTALCRLQDPRDPQCQVIKAFLFHMGCDPSPLVRMTVLKIIGASKHTLMFVFKRTMDVDEKVRLAAFKFFNDKVHIRSLTITCREELLKRGLNDKSKTVSNFVTKNLVSMWLSQCEGSIVKLLHSLDIGNSDGKTAEQVLKYIFLRTPYEQLMDTFTVIDKLAKLIPKPELTIETAFFWKNLVKFFHEEMEKSELSDAGTFLEQILPELTTFCNYVRSHFTELSDLVARREDSDEFLVQESKLVFIGKLLIDMTHYFDLSEEVGRRNLLSLCRGLMSSADVKVEFVSGVMSIYNVVQPKAERRVEEMAEIISDLRLPINTQKAVLLPTQQAEEERIVKENDLQKKQDEELRQKQVVLAQVKLQLMTAKESMENSIKVMDFIKAQELKLEVDKLTEQQTHLHEEIQKVKDIHIRQRIEEAEEQVSEVATAPIIYRNDPHIVFKCLAIITELLKPRDMMMMTPTMQMLLDDFVVPAASNVDAQIRKVAVKAIGCLCLRDLKASKRYSLLITEVCRHDCPEVAIAAIHSIIDLLMYFGPEIFEEKEHDPEADLFVDEDSEAPEKLISNGVDAVVALLCTMLDSADLDEDLQANIVEGLCKLVMSGLIISSKLLSRFIVTWFRPETEKKTKLSHILGAFLQLYPSLSSANQETLMNSLLLTIKTITGAPMLSPVSEINLEKVVSFYVDLTRSSYLQTKCETNLHDDFALLLSNQILKNPDDAMTKHYIKALLQLQISFDNCTMLKDLRELTNQMMDVVVEKTLIKSLEKFGARLDDNLSDKSAKTESSQDSLDFKPLSVSTQEIKKEDEEEDEIFIETTTTEGGSAGQLTQKSMDEKSAIDETSSDLMEGKAELALAKSSSRLKRKLMLPSSSSDTTVLSIKQARRGPKSVSSTSTDIIPTSLESDDTLGRRVRVTRTSSRSNGSQASSEQRVSSTQASGDLISSPEMISKSSGNHLKPKPSTRSRISSSSRTTASPGPSPIKRSKKK